MRDIYHDELDDIGRRVIEMTHLVAVAVTVLQRRHFRAASPTAR